VVLLFVACPVVYADPQNPAQGWSESSTDSPTMAPSAGPTTPQNPLPTPGSTVTTGSGPVVVGWFQYFWGSVYERLADISTWIYDGIASAVRTVFSWFSGLLSFLALALQSLFRALLGIAKYWFWAVTYTLLGVVVWLCKALLNAGTAIGGLAASAGGALLSSNTGMTGQMAGLSVATVFLQGVWMFIPIDAVTAWFVFLGLFLTVYLSLGLLLRWLKVVR
jgi:hypothetical protein